MTLLTQPEGSLTCCNNLVDLLICFTLAGLFVSFFDLSDWLTVLALHHLSCFLSGYCRSSIGARFCAYPFTFSIVTSDRLRA